jgi:alkanesulfonate monooxygenase SsuD/methylene tetrahydromethanopterin reductase-like flavin-dependent oxidoreductase (luciferase family)
MQGTPGTLAPAIHPWVAAGRGLVRFGVAYGPQIAARADWLALIGFVQAAEALGFDSYWTADHPTVWPDCWPTLALLAARTETIRLGPLVSCVAYRPAALTARLARDLDDASGGRLVLGLGAGDAPDEFARHGLPWGTPRGRQAALEAAASAILDILGNAAAPHAHQPRIPVLIAGVGERVTLRQVAQYADIANFGAHAHVGGAFTGADIARKFAALRDHCAALARPDDSVLRSHWAGPVVGAPTPDAVRAKLDRLPAPLLALFRTSAIAGTPTEVRDAYRALVAAGMQYCIAVIVGDDRETLHLLAEQVIPALRADAPAGGRAV